MKAILVPIDFSDVTARVMKTTLSFAKDLAAKVFLLYVVPPPIVLAGYDLSADHIPDHLLREQEEAKRRLTACCDELKAEGIHATALTVQGPPVESILLIAREREADLLIIGSHGHGAFYEFIVGSTARGVLREFPGPVVVVPCRSAQREQRAAS